jgi:DNA invertase Pin-like site-specific DNA recombinase
MSKIIAYLRVSTDKQELNNQKLEILEFARKNSIKVDNFIEVTSSSSQTVQQKHVSEVVSRLEAGDILIVTELSRLGRSTAGVISLVNQIITQNVKLIVIKQNLDLSHQDMNSKIIITLFSLFAELERDLISLRTKEVLAAKKGQGIKLGKPKGTIQKSKFDAHLDKIKELLKYGLSIRKIAKVLGYNNHISLTTYLKKRDIRAQLACTSS